MRSEPVTMAELMAALPHVQAAPKTDAPICALCFRPGYGERQFPDSLSLTRDRGIPGERWETAAWLKLDDGRPHPGIQVSILPSRVMDLVWRDREGQVHPGDPIVADLDTSEENLPEGTLLRAGTAILRVSAVFNEGCVKWKVRYGKEAKDWIVLPELRKFRLRGILCSVEQDGIVTTTDRICKL